MRVHASYFQVGKQIPAEKPDHEESMQNALEVKKRENQKWLQGRGSLFLFSFSLFIHFYSLFIRNFDILIAVTIC